MTLVTERETGGNWDYRNGSRILTLHLMTMRYAPLPATSSVEQALVQRSVRGLHGAVLGVERVLGNRSFRLLTLVTLNLLDLITTWAVLSLGGSESNPAMVGIVERWWTPILVKGVVLGLLWAAVLRAPTRSRVADAVLIIAWVFYAGVVGWNTLLLINY